MASIPPPPPPPQPAVHRAPTLLAHSQRTPTNRDNIGSVRPAQSSDRPPFAGIHPSTLLDAAARLRKTSDNAALSSRRSEQDVGRSSELSSGGHRSDFAQYAPMAGNSSGAAVYAPNAGTFEHRPVNFMHGRTVPINQNEPQNSSYSSNYTTTTTTNNFNSATPPLPTHPPPPQTADHQTPQSYSFSSSYSYNTPPQSYRNQPNSDGSHVYKSYASIPLTSTNGGTNSSHSTSQQGHDYIGNPKEYIHEFATKTPIAILSPHSNVSTHQYNYTTNETSTPSRIQKPLSYAEELRNSTLTERQRHLNQYQKSFVPEREVPGSFHNIYQETTTTRKNTHTDQVDDLVRDMEMRLQGGGRDICAKCSTPIVGDTPGVTALGRPYHVNCFTCDQCQKQLAGCSFYNVDNKNLCQVDYMNSLEKCEKCGTPITQKILRALGKPHHPECFTCPSCQKSLDGIPFTVSKDNIAYCLDCYHDRFSPRCAVCLKAIAPTGNETEVARVIAMDKSYHVGCYRCESCGLALNSKIEGQACYPLESHLFCKNCNLEKLKAVS